MENTAYVQTIGVANMYMYSGKELNTDLGIEWSDFGARCYDAAVGRWWSVDPLAESRYFWNGYNYGRNNPMINIDPTGMLDGIFLDEKGKVLGNDGKEDGKVYVIKTSEKEFKDGETTVAGAGLDKGDAKDTKSFVKENSGNSAAFDENPNVYNNFIEIEGNADTRQQMVEIVNQDDAKGGTSAANNREYGGGVMPDGSVVEDTPGAVGTPGKGAGIAHDKSAGADTYFHSHPSGTVTTGGPKQDPFGGPSTDEPTKTTPYSQPPSNKDVSNAGTQVRYVFGRGNGTVYIYNNAGVQATISQAKFVKQ